MIMFDTTVTSGDERCVTISVLDDDLVEGELSFSAAIIGTTPAVNFNDTIEVIVTIEDTDSESYNNNINLACIKGPCTWLHQHNCSNLVNLLCLVRVHYSLGNFPVGSLLTFMLSFSIVGT